MKNNKTKIIITVAGLIIFFTAIAATNIDSTNKWAWNDIIGWIDHYATNNVTVSSSIIQGYASSSIGYIAFDCATSPNGNICGTSNFSVANDGAGNLSGWAWNDAIGWISFYCGNLDAGDCVTSNYRVTIDGSGDFHNYAWNDAIGWISFNCNEPGFCGTSNYKVNTTWTAGGEEATSTGNLISSIFDTGSDSGAVPNSILWFGNQPAGTSVKFQIASATSTSGPWNYLGPDGSGASYYSPAGPDIAEKITVANHLNHRYFRYKVFLFSDIAVTQTPRVDDIILNLSK